MMYKGVVLLNSQNSKLALIFNYCFFQLLETLVEKMMFLPRAESAFPALD